MQHQTAENRERMLKLLREFRKRFTGEPTVVRAPGRVNLIGEHTDYNEGFVLPIAIDQDIRFAVKRRADRLVRLFSLNFGTESCFDLDHLERDETSPWGNYVRGMASALLKDGCLLHGMEGVVEGNVPVASGLSSSAAMEVAAGMAFCAISLQVIEPPQMARLAQQAENEYMGVKVGIMDPFISRMGHPEHALFLDCRSLQYELIPIPSHECLFVVTDSHQSRELAGSAYNQRREECERAVEGLRSHLPEIRALRDVSVEELEQYGGSLDPVVYRRARHVVTENDRVLRAVAALRGNDLAQFGRLMNASHDSLRDDYEVSSPALDCLVRTARASEGCLGSRLTGAGFGGCTVSLVRQEKVDAFCRSAREAYRSECGGQAVLYVTRPAAGAGLVPLA